MLKDFWERMHVEVVMILMFTYIMELEHTSVVKKQV